MKETIRLNGYMKVEVKDGGVNIVDDQRGKVSMSSETLERVYLEHLKRKNPVPHAETL